MKRCPECDTDKPKSEFAKNRGRKDGLGGWCKACMASWRRDYGKTEKFKAARATYEREYRKRPVRKEKMAARNALNHAIRDGKKKKPKHCCSCGSQYNGPIEGHHWKGYAEEFWLDVLWLCRSCHNEADERQKQQAEGFSGRAGGGETFSGSGLAGSAP